MKPPEPDTVTRPERAHYTFHTPSAHDVPVTPPKRAAWGRLALTLALAVYGISILMAAEPWSILDGVNLLVHEAGHLVFSPFGEFMTAAGGTIMQLLMPVAFWLSFRKRDPHAASVMLWWVAQNGWGIAIYAADARAQVLPLLNDGEHDWTYMLSRLGLLHADYGVSRTIWLASVILFGYAIFRGVKTAHLGGKAGQAAV